MIRTVSSARNLPPRSLSYPLRNIDPWVRNAEWPALPALADGDQKFVGLYAVYNTASEFIAVQAAGNYTVDWGDGTTQNVNSGVKADHQYTYASISGGPISLGYKIVVVTITPQSGQNLTAIYLNKRHSTQLSVGTTGWLDIAVNAPNATVIDIGGSSENAVSVVEHSMLESAHIRQNALIDMSHVFRGCRSIKSVCLSNVGTVYSTAYMFYGCSSLEAVPLFNTASVSNMAGMFEGCSNLVSAPTFNTASANNVSYMFWHCVSLQEAPAFNMSSAVVMEGMLGGCVSLKRILFSNTSSATNMAVMLYDCRALESIPVFDMSSAINVGSMFNNCHSLKFVPELIMNSAVYTEYMFSGCYSLLHVSQISANSAINGEGFFRWCYSLVSVAGINFASILTTTNMFENCGSLAKNAMTGLTRSVDYSGCNLSAAAINEIFTNLGTASGSQTITVKTNPGSATCTTSIATAKGWTVVTA